jgi:hypothetical protein
VKKLEIAVERDIGAVGAAIVGRILIGPADCTAPSLVSCYGLLRYAARLGREELLASA